MNKTRISIIIPVYNGANTINRCITSLKEQTLKECEFIFVDDGSSDNTVEKFKELTKEDHRFSIIKMGRRTDPFQARKRGILNSSGEYIMFLDADDRFIPTACEIAYKTITEKKVDAVLFGSEPIATKNISQDKLDAYKNYLKFENKIQGLYRTKEECHNLYFTSTGFGFATSLAKKIFASNILKVAINNVDSKLYLGYGQDLYQLIATMPYINSLYADNSLVLHEYFWGDGVTQGDVCSLSLEKYKRIISSHNTYIAIEEYLKKADLTETHKAYALQFAKKTLLHSAQKHLCYISDIYMPTGIYMLKNAWGEEYLQNFPNVGEHLLSRLRTFILNNPAVSDVTKEDIIKWIPKLIKKKKVKEKTKPTKKQTKNIVINKLKNIINKFGF